MTMTDGERAIVAQLKRIADALEPPTDTSFADVPVRRLAEGGYVGHGVPFPTTIRATLHEGEKVVPTESSNAVWERIMRGGEGDHLLHDDGKEGEDID